MNVSNTNYFFTDAVNYFVERHPFYSWPTRNNAMRESLLTATGGSAFSKEFVVCGRAVLWIIFSCFDGESISAPSPSLLPTSAHDGCRDVLVAQAREVGHPRDLCVATLQLHCVHESALPWQILPPLKYKYCLSVEIDNYYCCYYR